MQHQRTYSLPHEQLRRIEAAILALALAEDWPWRATELAQRLRLPVDVIGLGTATLRLLVAARSNRHCLGNDRLRASWTAVRCDELLHYVPGSARTNVERGCTPERPR